MATSPLAMLALTDDPVQQLLTNFAFVERTYGFKQEYLSKGRQYHHERLRVLVLFLATYVCTPLVCYWRKCLKGLTAASTN
jgi:hypothetical protein